MTGWSFKFFQSNSWRIFFLSPSPITVPGALWFIYADDSGKNSVLLWATFNVPECGVHRTERDAKLTANIVTTLRQSLLQTIWGS